MKRALGIAFSARRRANCFDCVSLCLDCLREGGFSTEIIDLFDYTIEPCSHCDYECLAEYINGVEEDCPKEDDLPEVYGKFDKADVVVMGTPVYCGQPPALFRAFQERSLGIYRYPGLVASWESKTLGFIVLKDHFTVEAATRMYAASGRSFSVTLHPLEFGGTTDVRTAMNKRIVEIPEARTKLEVLAGWLAADAQKEASAQPI